MERITLAHGNGGKLTQNLIEEVIYHYCGNEILLQQDDAAYLPPLEEGRLVTSTDSFVVDPLFFPGGDIGKLAICGTVNDLAVNGAKPLYLTLALILEEGFALKKLVKIIKSAAQIAEKIGVKIVAGDTKVVPQGKGGGVYINTTGFGILRPTVEPPNAQLKSGDKIIVSGSLGNHGAAILASQEGFEITGDLVSDCAPLNSLSASLLNAEVEIKLLTDPTRGGVAQALYEVVQYYQYNIELKEKLIPLRREVESLGEILGIDPLYLANEGRLLAIVAAEDAKAVSNIMAESGLGAGAAVIGEVQKGAGRVYLKTEFGGRRILAGLAEQLLPRIC